MYLSLLLHDSDCMFSRGSSLSWEQKFWAAQLWPQMKITTRRSASMKIWGAIPASSYNLPPATQSDCKLYFATCKCEQHKPLSSSQTRSQGRAPTSGGLELMTLDAVTSFVLVWAIEGHLYHWPLSYNLAELNIFSDDFAKPGDRDAKSNLNSPPKNYYELCFCHVIQIYEADLFERALESSTNQVYPCALLSMWDERGISTYIHWTYSFGASQPCLAMRFTINTFGIKHYKKI